VTRGQDGLLCYERYHISLLNSFHGLCEMTMALLPMLLLPASSQDQDIPGLEQATQFTMEIRCSLSDLLVADFELYRKQHKYFAKICGGCYHSTKHDIVITYLLCGQGMSKNSLGTGQSGMSSWIPCTAAAQKQYSAIRNHASNYCTVALHHLMATLNLGAQ